MWSQTASHINLSSPKLVPGITLLSLPWSLGERTWLRLITRAPVTQTFLLG